MERKIEKTGGSWKRSVRREINSDDVGTGRKYDGREDAPNDKIIIEQSEFSAISLYG